MVKIQFFGLYYMIRYILILWGIMLIGLGVALYSRYIMFTSSIQSLYLWDGVVLLPLAFIFGPILIGIGVFLLYRDSK